MNRIPALVGATILLLSHVEPPMTIAVFCGHRPDPLYSEVARQVGEGIARRSWRLVYGGGDAGLMGDVVRGARAYGGAVVGVTIPEYASGDRDERVAADLGERKETMLGLADAILVLPGGLGTHDELAHALAKKMDAVDGFQSRILLVNPHGYWDALLQFYQSLNASALGRVDAAPLYDVVSTAEEALETIMRT